MSNVQASSQIKSGTIEAVVIRKDGTREDLGVIASFGTNPLKRLLLRLLSRNLT